MTQDICEICGMQIKNKGDVISLIFDDPYIGIKDEYDICRNCKDEIFSQYLD